MSAADAPRRLDSIDALRGAVMVLMLLDHTRDFVHWASFQLDPTDLAKTWPALFFTRVITHFCAPIFVLLAGVSIRIQLDRGKSKPELSWFLLTRGFWLVVCEFTLVKFGIFFSLQAYDTFLGVGQVIWALGVCMIAMAGLLYLPRIVVLALGLTIVLGHNLLDPIQVAAWTGPASPVPGFWPGLWIILHQGGNAFPFGAHGPAVFFAYPVLPWIGVIICGFLLGNLFQRPAEDRQRTLGRLGLGLLVAFVAIRLLNGYGDPDAWKQQATAMGAFMSFLNTHKYPPSLAYLLMTLGPGLLALAWLEGRRLDGLAKPLVTFGRVPMFFYLLQWPMAHGLGMLFHAAAGKPVAFLHASPADTVIPPPGAGFSLAWVYLAWVLGILLLFPLCRWFAGMKARRKDWWLSYL